MTDSLQEDATPITELSKPQRRVLGVLVEKGFTTPEYYPLTLKAITTGCNQKSNRDPIVNYSEEDVEEALDQLREMGLVAVVHTESGRTERFRHYMRHRFTFTEPQLAILTELLLRGRQQLGELRSRAGRMVAINSLDSLRDELRGLQAMNLVQASGPLERRGVEVDHNLYRSSEGRTLATVPDEEPGEEGRSPGEAAAGATAASGSTSPAAAPEVTGRMAVLETTAEQLRLENRELRDELETLKDEVRRMADQMEDLRRDLGG